MPLERVEEVRDVDVLHGQHERLLAAERVHKPRALADLRQERTHVLALALAVQREFKPISEFVLEVDLGAEAPQRAEAHDSNPRTQGIRFLHGVLGATVKESAGG